MISIIICSVNKKAVAAVIKNITTTIDVAFETIIIDNSIAKLGICDAYNQGAAKAKYDIFCFMHEDISFESVGWGQKVIDHLSAPDIGLIGLAGGDIKSLTPSSWDSLISINEISYVQHFKNPDKPPEKISRTNTPADKATLKKVVCIDGFWMCTKRSVFNKHAFDANTFKGFHGYDIDFSLQISTAYKVGVVFDIIVHHYSEGSFDKTWMNSSITLSKKWKSVLPLSVYPLPKATLTRQHWTAMRSFVNKLIALGYSIPVIYMRFFQFAFNRFFHFKHFLHFIKYIVLQSLKKRHTS